MRTFSAIVKHPRTRKLLAYPEMPAADALQLIETLEQRGLSVHAETTAHGITEKLTSAELREFAPYCV